MRLVVPLNDLDHPVLARERHALAPALLLLPERRSANMSDKLEAHRFFVEHGIPSPRSWEPADVPEDSRFPLLVKARQGFGPPHLPRRRPRAARLLPPLHDGRVVRPGACLGEEFSIDVLCDMEGRCLNAIPRTMLLSKGGESIKGASIQDAS